MRPTTISTFALTLLTVTACTSTPKATDASDQAPATIAAPAPTPEVGVPAVSPSGVSAAACDKGRDHRTLDLRTKGDGCETVYTKHGQAAVVAKAKHGVAKCERALNKIKQKLIAAGYTCP